MKPTMMTTRRKVFGLATAICLAVPFASADEPQVGKESASPASESAYQNRKPAKDSAQAESPAEFNRVSKLLGMSVRNRQKEKLGDIKDLVIDLESGKVAYLVLSSGGVLGIGDKLLAVPLNAFTFDQPDKCLVLNASLENIDRAKGLDEDWPSIREPNFAAMPFWKQPVETGSPPGHASNPPKSGPEPNRSSD